MLRNDFAAAAIVTAAVLLVYCNALTGPFQFDDHNVIVHNAQVHSVAAWLDAMPGIRPLLKLSYMLNWIADPGPFGFHLVNVAVHAANAFLVYCLLRRLRTGQRSGDWAPLVGALLFALHPIQTEAVTYICGRSVSLMALFYLGSVQAWLHNDRDGAAGGWRMLSAALFGLAMLVKETAITLPLALLLLDANAAGRHFRVTQMLRRQAWLGLVLIGALAAIALSPTYRHLLDVSIATRSLVDNLLTQANAICYLAGQLLAPWRANVDPDLPVLTTLTPAVALQAAAILAALVVGLVNLRRRTWLSFAILWFFVHLLPTNSLLPRLDVANDRQLYLASIGPFFAIGVGVQSMLEHVDRRRRAAWAIGLVLLVIGCGTVLRNQVYRSQATLWEDAMSKSPSKARVANNLGYAYQQAGRFDEARAAYLRAIELDPSYWKARINLDVLESGQQR
jgi:protein O-mannosyl-transferase